MAQLTPEPEFDPGWMRLGTYNAERARGLVHTPEWQAKMAAEQERFDTWSDERRRVAASLRSQGWRRR